MENSLISGGREYISSSRAGELSGYSSDYIGQLCRSGKVASRLVGRTWFVDVNSLLDHKKNTKPGRASKYGHRKIIYSYDDAPLMPHVSKVKTKQGSYKFNTAKLATGLVMVVMIVVGVESLSSSGEYSSLEKFSLATASASRVAEDLMTHSTVVEVAKNISVFELSLQTFEFIRSGYENMKEVIKKQI